jgi:hypothetical protein
MMPGFSLFETLIALTLSSLIMILLMQNVSELLLADYHLKIRTQAEDESILSLITLEHQLDKSRRYQILSPTTLQLTQDKEQRLYQFGPDPRTKTFALYRQVNDGPREKVFTDLPDQGQFTLLKNARLQIQLGEFDVDYAHS